MKPEYKVTEVFSSIQGEGRWVGHQMSFLRFAGCNLKCSWCDQPTSSSPGDLIAHPVSDDTILNLLEDLGHKRVCITGGEPLLQMNESLFSRMIHRGYLLHLETNGTLNTFLPFHWITVSPKGPIDRKIYDRADELKFVVDDKFQVSDVMPNYKNAQVYLTPCNDRDTINVKSLERTMKILKNHDNWALSVQLHKLLGVR